MGLGFATLIPQGGNIAMETANVPGIKLSGMIFDAGPRNSSALLVVGTHGRGGWHYGSHEDTSAPTLVQDVFFRVGGAEPGRATNSLIVNPTTPSLTTCGRGARTTVLASAGPVTPRTPA